MLGLSPLCRTTPILKALEINLISHVVDKNSLNMFHNVMKTHSGARTFYMLILKHNVSCSKLLTSRVRAICNNSNLDFNMSYMCHSELKK